MGLDVVPNGLKTSTEHSYKQAENQFCEQAENKVRLEMGLRTSLKHN